MSGEISSIAELFEADFLDWVRTVTIFIVVGIAIFNFTPLGKIFSLISLFIALFLLVTLIFDYINERQKVIESGSSVKTSLDILFGAVVITFFFLVWIIYEVWKVDPAEGFKFPIALVEEELELLADKILKGVNSNNLNP